MHYQTSGYKSLDQSLIKGDCLVPEDIHTHQMRDIGNSKGGDGGGVSKVKIYKGKYEVKLEFTEG